MPETEKTMLQGAVSVIASFISRLLRRKKMKTEYLLLNADGIFSQAFLPKAIAQGGAPAKRATVAVRGFSLPAFFSSEKKVRFTLIELLIVVAIIAILAGLLLPALQKARETSKRIVCVNQNKQMMHALEMYGSDYSDMYPGIYSLFDTWDTGKEQGNWIRHGGPFDMNPQEGILWDYIKNTKVYVCPSDKSQNTVSYALNRQAHFYRKNRIRKASGKLIILEESCTQDGAPVYTNDGCFSYWIAKGWKDYVRDWHSAGSVYSYADGHVLWEKMEIETAWERCDIFNELGKD